MYGDRDVLGGRGVGGIFSYVSIGFLFAIRGFFS